MESNMADKANRQNDVKKIEGEEFRRLQLIGLELVTEFDRVCRENDIKYSMDGGTLLGAVRHKGFIPWDDDIDVMMLREDYDRFRKVVGQLNPEICFWQDHETDPEYRWGYGKLRRTGTTFIRAGQEHIKCKTGVCMDVLPLDDVPKSLVGQMVFDFYCFLMRKILWSEVGKYSEKNLLKRICYRVLSHIHPDFVFRQCKRFEKKSRNDSENRVRVLTLPAYGKYYKIKNPIRERYGMPKEWLRHLVWYEFEGIQLPGVKDYDAYLTYAYGDYRKLPPEEDRVVHAPVSSYSLGFQCRICSGKSYHSLFQWSLPLAADMKERPQGDIKYPIEPVICETCGHVQLKETLSVNMYGEYLYTPSFSREFQDYINIFTENLNERYKDSKSKKVVEIGSSNGHLLLKMMMDGWDVLGFEPSSVLVDAAKKSGVHTEQMYFGSDESIACIKKWGTPDLIIVRHVMEHLDQLNYIVSLISQLLDDGMFVMEVPWLLNIVKERQFYAFFHEHVSYFSIACIQALLNQYGLTVIDIAENSLEGGSIAIYATKSSRWKHEKDKIDAYLEQEKIFCSKEAIKKFSMEGNKQRDKIREFIEEQKARGKKLAAWGAGQRGVSLLNLCSLTVKEIDYVIDINENYWWKYIPGDSGIRVVPPEWLNEHFVDFIIIFATGYADEIINGNQEYVKQGGQFVNIIEN